LNTSKTLETKRHGNSNVSKTKHNTVEKKLKCLQKWKSKA